jgi:hypothetical protein
MLRLTPYVEEIIGEHECIFRRNSLSADLHSTFVKYLGEKKFECKEEVHKPFINFNVACDLVREVLYNNAVEFGIPVRLSRLTEICLYKTKRQKFI